MVKFEDLTSIKQEIMFSMTQNIFTHITTVQETWHNFTVKLAYQYSVLFLIKAVTPTMRQLVYIDTRQTRDSSLKMHAQTH
jgi:hypothetical protein